MESYKQRLVDEYKQLKNRVEKLQRMLDRYNAGTLDFVPDCPIAVLSRQLLAMIDYKSALEDRAEVEGIPIAR